MPYAVLLTPEARADLVQQTEEILEWLAQQPNLQM